MNAVAFRAYVEQILAPTLDPGDIVVMDNLPAHKGAAVRAAIQACGASLILLPPYSPDFNPIETPSPSSNRGYARPPPEPSRPWKQPSRTHSIPSRRKNAQTTSRPQDMVQHDRNLL
jgi:transposase